MMVSKGNFPQNGLNSGWKNIIYPDIWLLNLHWSLDPQDRWSMVKRYLYTTLYTYNTYTYTKKHMHIHLHTHTHGNPYLFFGGSLSKSIYIYLEPKWTLFWMVNLQFYGSKPSKQGSFGFQVYIYILLDPYVHHKILKDPGPAASWASQRWWSFMAFQMTSPARCQWCEWWEKTWEIWNPWGLGRSLGIYVGKKHGITV